MKKIILASESPRRKELLAQLGLSFEVMPSNIDENEIAKEEDSPAELVKKLSGAKAELVSTKVDCEAVIIAADTVVAVLRKE